MNTEEEQQKDLVQPDPDTNANEAAAEPRATGKSILSALPGILGLILAALAVAFAAYNYQNLEGLSNRAISGEQIEQLSAQYRQLDSAIQQSSNEISMLQQRSNEISTLSGGQQALESRLQDLVTNQDSINRSIEQLYADQGREQYQWPVAEVEHLINIANIRLMLEQDPQTALIALEMADRRLAELGDPGLFSVRRQLASEMNALRSVTPVDITGLALYLADLATRVTEFPLKQSVVRETARTGPAIDPTLPAWKRLVANVWSEFKGMFIITRIGDQLSATLLPDEKYFIYQNLRLQLEVARLAVLRRDTENLEKSLQIISQWLDSYFDGGDTTIINIMRRIERMHELELAPVLPDISSSLNGVRAYLDNNRPGPDQSAGGVQ